MKKYKVTDKHPELKEGIEIFLFDELFDEWINNKWVKEIKEPKWTDDDMINAIYKTIEYINTNYDSDAPINETGNYLYNELFGISKS